MNTPKSTDISAGGKFHVSGQRSTRRTSSLSSLSNDTEDELKIDSSPESFKEEKHQKPSPTNQKLLSELQTIKIDRSKYHHYGHGSLMTSKSLEKIIQEAKDRDEKDKEQALDKGLKIETENLPVPASQDLENKSNTTTPIEKYIADILNVDVDSMGKYSTETINEIIKLKTEQEVTKRELIKNELAGTTMELLKLAKSLNLSPEIIPFIFLSDTKTEELREKLYKLLSETELVVKRITEEAAASEGRKRKISSSILPSFSETEENIKRTTRPASPVRSPTRLPSLLVHRRVRSDTSEKDASPLMTNPKPVLLPLPLTSYQSLPPQYPLYYNVSPPGTESKFLGSPYTQKQPQHLPSQPVVVQQPPLQLQPLQIVSQLLPPQNSKQLNQLPPQQALQLSPQRYLFTRQQQQLQPPLQQQQQQPQQLQQYGGAYVPQKSPYQYYATTTPPKGGVQYLIPPVPSIGAPLVGAPIAPPSTTSTESEKSKVPGGGSILRFDKEETEEPPTKKLKQTSKSSNINFMITTPENPPAKKYNNSRQ